MKENSDLQSDLYRAIGEEIARKEYFPGPIARAVAEALGNKNLVQSLYIKFRYEELSRQMEKDIAENAKQDEQQTQKRNAAIIREQQQGIYRCSKCGFHGKPDIKRRGSIPLMIILMCFYFLPGIIYAIFRNGNKAMCPTCGYTICPRI